MRTLNSFELSGMQQLVAQIWEQPFKKAISLVKMQGASRCEEGLIVNTDDFAWFLQYRTNKHDKI